MTPTQAEERLLFIAATKRDRNALNFVHLALPHLSSTARQQVTSVLGARRGEDPPDLMDITGVDVEKLLTHELDGPAYLCAEQAYKFLLRARLEKRCAWLASTLTEKGDIHPADRLARAVEEGQGVLAESGHGHMVSKVLSVADMGEKYREREREGRGIALGLGKIDEAIRGVTPGQVMTIGGKAGVGKTALALHILRGVCPGKSGLFFSIEMPAADIWERLAQAYYEETHQRIANLTLLEKLNDVEVYEAYPGLRVVDVDTLTLERMVQFIRLEKQAGRADLVVVDYLQRMKGSTGKRYDVISELALGVKSVAKSQDVPVVLLSQLSREAQDRTTPVRLHMFRDSGQIEEAADYVIGVWIESAEMVCEGLKLRRAAEGLTVRFETQLETMTLRPNFEERA